jgi:hypothetical protein
VTIASWLLIVDPGCAASVTAALARPGHECRSEARGRLVVVTESPSRGLEDVHRELAAARGVRDAALVAAFEDESGR